MPSKGKKQIKNYKCPGCGTLMDLPDYKFCTNCGTQLYEDFSTDKVCGCGTITASRHETCKKCGKDLKQMLLEDGK